MASNKYNSLHDVANELKTIMREAPIQMSLYYLLKDIVYDIHQELGEDDDDE
jgi:hypothetical protein